MSDLNRDKLNSMNAGRKADREYITAELLKIASNRGASAECREEPRNIGYHGATIHLEFRSNGVGAMIDVDNLYEGQCTCIHWFNSNFPVQNFTRQFKSGVLAVSRMRAFHKATSIPPDWFSLAMALDAGLMLAQRGEALEPPATK